MNMRMLFCIGVATSARVVTFNVKVFDESGELKGESNDPLNPRGGLFNRVAQKSPDDKYYGNAVFTSIETHLRTTETLTCLYAPTSKGEGEKYGSYTYTLLPDYTNAVTVDKIARKAEYRLNFDYLPRLYGQSRNGVQKLDDKDLSSPQYFVQKVYDGGVGNPVSEKNKGFHRVVRKFCNLMAELHAHGHFAVSPKGDLSDSIHRHYT